MKHSVFTDKWGVTYSDNGKVLCHIDSDKFLCEEYTIPEGVERIPFGLLQHNRK